MTSIDLATAEEFALDLWYFTWNYNIAVGVLALFALIFTRRIWYRQSQYARIAWLALVLYTVAIVYGTIESRMTRVVPGPRGVLFSCAVTATVVVCSMFYVDKSRRR